MSVKLLELEQSGSRRTQLDVDLYYGGEEQGKCLQLTQVQENGKLGYVQLTEQDLVDVLVALRGNAKLTKVNKYDVLE